MRRALILSVLGLFAVTGSAMAQKEPPKLHVHAFLIDKNVNMKDLAGITVVLTPFNGTPGSSVTLKTAADGTIDAVLPAGDYHLSTPNPTDFNGEKYTWQMDITVGNVETAVDLSNDNAKIESASIGNSSLSLPYVFGPESTRETAA